MLQYVYKEHVYKIYEYKEQQIQRKYKLKKHCSYEIIIIKPLKNE